MKQKLLFFFVTMILFYSTALYAQNRTISGTVIGADDGLPIPGASVKVKGTSLVTQTKKDGNFSIVVPQSATSLIFSYLGYVEQEVKITNSNQLNIKLVASLNELSEVVISGYGIKQSKRDLTGANAIISGKDIANIPVQSFDNALSGRAAGVQITSSSGIPGANVTVNIRGISSITAGNDPLYIVDGVEVISGDKSRAFPTSNALAGINPNDIESINIMKDASAASIYGAQAANGVVIITTKRGKSGKTQINFNSFGGISKVIEKAPILNTAEFITLSREAIINRYGSIALAPTAVQTVLSSFGDPLTAPTYDWQDAVYRNGALQNYDLSASGGDCTDPLLIGQIC